MINKRETLTTLNLILGFLLLSVILINLLPLISSVDKTICCEKTVKGAVCLDTTPDNCAAGAKKADTSCQQTSFCKMGTCIDNTAGECKPNTPKKACDNIQGAWDERESSEIPECKLGCCFIGESTSFVTKTQCKTQAGLFGVEMNFDKTITNSAECIASGLSEDKGACVYQTSDEFGNTCKFTTEKECRKMKTDSPDSNAEFFKDYLCTAEELNTNCAKTQKTICNNEMVYFTDTCGNLANVYDASKITDSAYWTKIVKPEESCGIGESNADSQTCGTCNYYAGSTCSEAKRGETAIPKYGNYICRDLGCEYDANGDGTKEKYQHGESWCAIIPGTSKINENKTEIPNPFKENLPGSRYVVLSCRDGTVDYSECDDFRTEVCIQNTVYPNETTPFRSAKCSLNLWRDCINPEIKTKEDCENTEKRDCKWVPTLSRTDDNRLTTWKPNQEGDSAPLIKTDNDLPLGRDLSSSSVIKEIIKIMGGYHLNVNLNDYSLNSKNMISFQNGACVPKYAPGFAFTNVSIPQGINTTEEAANICSLASVTCVIKKEKSLGGTWKSVENSECEDSAGNLWYESMKNICSSLGDCGSTVNYIGEKGDEKKDLVRQ